MSAMLHKIYARMVENIPFLLLDRHLPLSERLKVAFARDRDVAAGNFILKHCLGREGGDEFLELDGLRFYFDPDYPVKDRDTLRLGAAQVLAETFLFPSYASRHAPTRPGDVVIDLGANIGTVSMIYARMVGEAGAVHAFEPVMHATMARNLRENGVRNVILNPVGVSDRKGTAEIEVSDFALDSSICHREYTRDYYSERRTIDLIDLDSYCREKGLERVDLIKMDIEGAEELALRGAGEVIRKYRPKWVISSYHTDFENELQHPKLLRILKGHGYRIEEIPYKRIVAY